MKAPHSTVGPDGIRIRSTSELSEEASTLDQPTAEQALQKLELLTGEWTLEAILPLPVNAPGG